MDMFNVIRKLVFWFRQPPFEPDDVLDFHIREALLEETNLSFPPGAWERLRRAIVEHQTVTNQGMWILDEPFRDPPESSPTLLTQQQFERVRRIYNKPQYNSPNWVMMESFRFSFAVIVSF